MAKKRLFDLPQQKTEFQMRGIVTGVEKKNFFKIENLVVAYFSSDGISSVNIIQSIKEQEKVKSEYGVKSSRLKWSLIAYKKQLFVMVKRCVPQKIWELWSIRVKKKSIC